VTEYGYSLSSEEHRPERLPEFARQAEQSGFSFALISDHYHPWIDRQGQSGFVWSMLGAIAAKTERLRVGTGVTCPLIRTHPAIIAQAAATMGCLMPGRFLLGVGAGENLNEHIIGAGWPSATVRREMLREAVEVIRELWRGESVDHYGEYYTVEDARIYSVPKQLPPIYVAASGEKSAQLAGEIGDGYIGTSPEGELVQKFDASGGHGKPRYAQVTVCYAQDEAEARRMAYEIWPNSALRGELTVELPLPRHFEQASKMAREEDVAKMIVCGPDPERHIEKIRQYEEAGFDHIYVHQVGPDQDGFFRFYEREVLPMLGQRARAA